MFIKKDGSLLSRDNLVKVLAEILNESTSKPVNPIENCVTLLTSDARQNWANARNQLIKGKSRKSYFKANSG